uniref:Serpentine receptor class gamma n=1 Tax=Panagrellus redivivus TaxID=6233 RepID=A0A7E4W3W4_PANRE
MTSLPSDLVAIAITIPLWLFQISVTIFLIYFRYKKLKLFEPNCFNLFIMLEVTNSLNELTLFLMRRLSLLPFIQPFYLTSPIFSSILYAASAYTLYTMCFLRVAITINQLNSVQALLSQSTLTFGIYGKIAIPLIPLFPLPLLFRRFFYPAPFFRHSNGNLFVAYLDCDIQRYQSIVSAIVLVSTSLLAFCITMITILKYRALSVKTDLNMMKVKKIHIKHHLLCKFSHNML